MLIFDSLVFANASRTPHGVRGLKYVGRIGVEAGLVGRTPHGVRGLKYRRPAPDLDNLGRTPHGVRGLK